MADAELQLKISLAKAGLASDAAEAARQIERALGGVETDINLNLNTAQVKAIEAAIGQIASESVEAARIAKQLTDEYGLSEQEVNKAVSQIQKMQAETQRAANEAARIAEAAARAEAEFQNLARLASDVTVDFDADPAQADRLRQAVEQVANETLRAKKEADFLRSAYNLSDAQVRDVQRAMAALEKETRDAKSAAGGLDSVLQGIGQGVGEAIFEFGGQAIEQIKELVGSTIQVGVAAEQSKVAFTTMLGSAEEAESTIASLKNFAATTPFEFPEVRQAAQSLVAFGFAGKELEPTLRRIGDIASGVGTDVGELAVIYGKARVAGRLYAEDVNQLTERGIPIIQELAKQFGVTESEVKQLVEQGKVGFPQLEEAFVSLTSEGGKFFGLMEAQSQTVGGQISNLADQFVAIQENVFAAFGPALAAGLTFVGQALQEAAEGASLQPLSEAAERFATAIDNPELIEQFGQALAALADGLVGAVAGGLDLVTGAIASLATGTGTFASLAEFAGQAFGAISSVVGLLIDVGTVLFQAISPVIGVFFELQSVSATVLQSIAEAVRDVVQAVGNFLGTLFAGFDLGGIAALEDTIGGLAQQMAALAGGAIQAVAAGFDRLSGYLRENPKLVERFQAVIGNLATALQKIIQLFGTIAGGVGSAVGTLFQGLSQEGGLLSSVFERLGPILNFLLRVVQALSGAMVSFLDFAIERVAVFVQGFEEALQTILNIKIAAEGGVGEGLAQGLDQASASLGQAGEQVAQLSKSQANLADQSTTTAQSVETAADREKAALDNLAAASAEADSKITQSQQARIAAIKQSQLDGVLSAEQAAEQIAAIELDTTAQVVAAKQAELDQVRALRDQGTLSAEKAAEMERTLVAEIGALNLQRLDAELAAQEAVKQAALERAELENELAQSALEQQEQLAGAQQNLAAALGTLEQEKLKTRLAAAEAAGDEAAAEAIRQQLKAAEIEQEAKAFEFKARTLELQLQQNKLEAELALIRARANGASAEEIANLEKQVALIEEIGGLQKRQLEAERQTAAERRKQADIKDAANAQRGNAGAQPDLTPASSRVASDLPAAVEDQRRNTSKTNRFESRSGQYFINGQPVSLEDYRAGNIPTGATGAAPTAAPTAADIAPRPVLRNPQIDNLAAAEPAAASASTGGINAAQIISPILAKIDLLQQAILALAASPRSLTVQTPDAVADLSAVLAQVTRLNAGEINP